MMYDEQRAGLRLYGEVCVNLCLCEQSFTIENICLESCNVFFRKCYIDELQYNL